MNKQRQLTVTLVTLAMLAEPLSAWNNFGHMVVASVAYRSLDSQTRDRIATLLALNPYFKSKWAQRIPSGTAVDDRARMIFMMAATWPDAIKQDAQYHNDGAQGGDSPTGPESSRNTGYDDFNRHKYWHFVDLAFGQDGTNVSSLNVPTPDAQTQISALRVILRSPDSSSGLKSYDMVWLLHLVGDVHQPLHCATRVSAGHPQGDAGGNDVGFCSASAKQCTGELHAFWDDILGASNLVASADRYAAALTAPSVSAADIADAQKWIDESFAFAKSRVYVAPVGNGDGPFTATPEYTANARALAKQRVALAGARLAKVLQTELK